MLGLTTRDEKAAFSLTLEESVSWNAIARSLRSDLSSQIIAFFCVDRMRPPS
jgi:hypothetical protein